MAEEATNIQAVKTSSDGMVKITIEKYNELLETIATKDGSISRLTDQLRQVRSEPPVINRTIVQKTPEMLAAENRAWGNTFLGLGASMVVVGAYRRYKAGS